MKLSMLIRQYQRLTHIVASLLANVRVVIAHASIILCVLLGIGGCSLVPETRTRDTLHNPFPQLKRVAVLPFFNQSDHPTLDGDAVARAYYSGLQAIPGFEVLPVGVTANQWRAYSAQYGEPRSGEDFQRLAKMMDVEAIVVGSVTDFESYYPPRMAMTVHWYAANEGFHPIPAGYGLPWGTKGEEKIPARIVREAEFELARSQMKTQTPTDDPTGDPMNGSMNGPMAANGNRKPPATPTSQSSPRPLTKRKTDIFAGPEDEAIAQVSHTQAAGYDEMELDNALAEQQIQSPMIRPDGTQVSMSDDHIISPDNPVYPMADGQYVQDDIHGQWMDDELAMGPPLPSNWPEPTDLIPDPPAPVPPVKIAQHDPVLTHTRLYRADDPYFTQRLADYVETGDDARGMSWQGYIKRSDDFIRFCCHLHIVEMLEARGGHDPSDLILRWPVSRY
ncbi:hypothetical protein [Neorhodopirellula lusitana]|nr:hypothetical protein [Neorhodopirellula lusitana]